MKPTILIKVVQIELKKWNEKLSKGAFYWTEQSLEYALVVEW
jgi:hypothetical protein